MEIQKIELEMMHKKIRNVAVKRWDWRTTASIYAEEWSHQYLHDIADIIFESVVLYINNNTSLQNQ
jgi:hypothetical protein